MMWAIWPNLSRTCRRSFITFTLGFYHWCFEVGPLVPHSISIIWDFTLNFFSSNDCNANIFCLFTLPAYLASGSYNVLVLDYSRPLMLYSTPLVCYTRAALTSTLLVASCSTNFLVKMIQAGVLVSLSRVHIIGHSLGAHIAGDVSARLTKQGFGRVDRVTGKSELFQPTKA